LAVALLAASCDSGSSDKASESSATSTTKAGANATDAAAKPVGPEAAVARYLASQGISYAGDCATAKLPRDKGKWCSTLISGGDSNDQRVYGIGPVGSDMKKVITVNRHGQAKLTPGDAVGVSNGDVGQPQALSLDELAANPFIVGNLKLDQQAGIGNGVADLKSSVVTPTATTAPGGGGTGGGGGGGTPTQGPVVEQGGGATDEEYPPGSHVVVQNPNVDPGGTIAFQGSGCAANEVLAVQFDGATVGSITADPKGNFSGSLSVPPGTKPGEHTLTVRGQVCVLNAMVNVLGANAALAFTGSSNHTFTYVLAGISAVMVGAALVVGARRRRRIGRSGSPPSLA
jgi:LPXTG-motif cell wall-anchored protein